MWQKARWNRIVTFIYTEEGEVIEKTPAKAFWKGFVLIEGNLKVHSFYRLYLVLIIIRLRIFRWLSLVACDNPLGMEAHEIWDGDVTANSHRSLYEPYRARLNGASGWQVQSDRSNSPFIQVKFGSGDFTLTGVATQAAHSNLVKSYTLSYSYDGIDWVDYREDGRVKVF